MIKFFLPIPFMWLMVFLTYKNRKLMPLLFILNIAYDVASFLVGIEMNIEYNFVSDTYQNFFAFLLGIVWLICLTISELIAVFQKNETKL
ncbi:hypothetical protein [Limosilactobacillus equigenerosi]|uniref:hypothetical protein n=1 Tax=Limosilactobacillus equigenerosi TaxID=417373 RepID=UPI0006D153BE|nr:hypothetical protein [Limosilactobacillus equigenerosi]